VRGDPAVGVDRRDLTPRVYKLEPPNDRRVMLEIRPMMSIGRTGHHRDAIGQRGVRA
jgi:hypothetical protein